MTNQEQYDMLWENAQKRAAWLQSKYVRMKDNYESRINNLQNKNNHYLDCYTDMKGE